MTISLQEFSLDHLINVDHRQAATDPQNKPTDVSPPDLGCTRHH